MLLGGFNLFVRFDTQSESSCQNGQDIAISNFASMICKSHRLLPYMLV